MALRAQVHTSAAPRDGQVTEEAAVGDGLADFRRRRLHSLSRRRESLDGPNDEPGAEEPRRWTSVGLQRRGWSRLAG